MARHTMNIDEEFDRLKNIRENKIKVEVMDFLEKSRVSMQSKGMSNSRDQLKRSLMHHAAMGNCTQLLLQLIETGASVEDLDQNRRTPLSWAAEYGSYDVVRILVERGAKVNALDDMYTAPLSWLKHAGGPRQKDLAATKAYLKKNGGRRKGEKRAWVLRKLRLL